MATYHLQVKSLKGEVFPKIAYRTRSGKYKGQAEDVFHSEILLPERYMEWDPPERWVLWEYIAGLPRSRREGFAKEVIIGLPKELTPEEQIHLSRQLTRELCNAYSVVADLNVHRAPSPEKGNYHAHIVMANRRLELEGEQWRFFERAKLLNSPLEIRRLRLRWEEILNQALAAKGMTERVSSRSLIEDGINRLGRRRFPRQELEEERRTGVPCPSRKAFCQYLFKIYQEEGMPSPETFLTEKRIKEQETRRYFCQLVSEVMKNEAGNRIQPDMANPSGRLEYPKVERERSFPYDDER